MQQHPFASLLRESERILELPYPQWSTHYDGLADRLGASAGESGSGRTAPPYLSAPQAAEMIAMKARLAAKKQADLAPVVSGRPAVP